MIPGWWYTYPSEKWWSSSVGIMKFPTEWQNKKIFQTTNQSWGIVLAMPAKSRDMTSFQIKGAERTSWRLWPKTFLGILWKETKKKKHKNTTASPKKKQFCYNFTFRNWAKNRLNSANPGFLSETFFHCRDAPNAVAPFFPLWHLVFERFARCF